MAEYKNLENIRNLFDEEFKRIENLISKGETHLDNLAEGFAGADRVISRLPTADVVEVVRCKDCKHSYINSFSAQSAVALCKFWTNRAEGNHLVVQQDDYCSYGERKCDEW